jgi:hypothetical protein
MIHHLTYYGCHLALAAGIYALGLHWAAAVGLWLLIVGIGGDTLFRAIAQSTRR